MRRADGLLARFFVLALTGCSSREIALELDFEPDALAESARAVEVYVVAGCEGQSLGSAPTSPLGVSTFRRGERAAALGSSLPERFGVQVLARDESCAVVAAGCTDESRGAATVRVTLRAQAGAACSGRCVAGLCGEGPSPDAGTHEPLDAGAADTRVIEAGGLESSCDCVDDDSDGLVDEGCAAAGAGTFAAQRILDGPGIDGLRGAVVGGDGRVWINGWVDQPSEYGCGRTFVPGPSYLSAFDPVDLTCMEVFERPAEAASLFTMPQRSSTGVRLFTSDGLRSYPGAATPIVTEPPPLFLGGIAESAASRLLVAFLPSAAGVTEVGSASASIAAGEHVLALVDGSGDWVRSVPAPGLAAWLDPGARIALLANNGPISDCPNTVDGPARIEVRLASNGSCQQAVGIPQRLDRELTMVVSEGRIWILAQDEGEGVWLVAVEVGGAVLVRALPPNHLDANPRHHLVAARGGGVFFAARASAGGVVDGRSVAGGYVASARVEDGAIAIGVPRRFGAAVVGLDMTPMGVGYVQAELDNADALCDRAGPERITTNDQGARVLFRFQY